MDLKPYFQRKIEKQVETWLKNKEGLLLGGARQVGKSTYLRHLANRFPNSRYLSFDDRETFAQFKSNPQGLLEQVTKLNNPVFIDEFQKIPEITVAVKHLFDNQIPTPKFFLSGSVSDALISGGDSMSGRIIRLALYSLSFNEYLQAKNTHALSFNLSSPNIASFQTDLLEKTSLLNAELNSYLQSGGYPAIINFLPDQLNTFFQSIETSFLEKDLLGKLREGQIGNLQKLTVILSKRVGFPLSLNSIAIEIGIDIKTVKKLLDILKYSYWIEIITPKAKFGSEFKNKFKVYFLDNGLRNFLANDFDVNSGPLLENFVFGTIRRHFDYNHSGTTINFWHTYDGGEVDFIVEKNGKTTIFEVKNKKLTFPNVPTSLKNYIKKYHPKIAYIINRNLWGEKRIDKTQIYFIPAYAFGLL